MLNAAASHHHLAAAQWLRQQGAEWPTVLRFDMQSWDTDVLQWARDEGCTSPTTDTTTDTTTAGATAATAATAGTPLQLAVTTRRYVSLHSWIKLASIVEPHSMGH
jgi:hypothetical protein